MQHKFLQHEVPAKATRREWIGLAVIAIPCLIYSMDLTVLYLAVPEIVADLRPSAAGLLWIVDIYGFMVAGALVTMGTLGDRIGRRKVLLIGAAAFGITPLQLNGPQYIETPFLSRRVWTGGGRVELPEGPGLGVEVDTSKLQQIGDYKEHYVLTPMLKRPDGSYTNW